MFTSIASLRDEYTTEIRSVVPESWRIRTAVATLSESPVPVVYLEFREFSTSDARGDLPPGVVSATVDVVVTDPQTDSVDGEDAVDIHVLNILNVFDPLEDVYWDTAVKERFDNGVMGWRLATHALVNTKPTE